MIEESLADKVKKVGRFFRHALIYSKPRATKVELVESLVEMLRNFDLQTFPIVNCDDFNIDILKEHLLTQNHSNIIHSNCFRLLPNGPALVSDDSVFYFDHCIYQYLLNDCVIFENQNISEYYYVLLKWNIQGKTETKKKLYGKHIFSLSPW